MNDKELYQQKKQAELDEWQAKLDELQAQASGASADAQLKLKEQIKVLEGKIEEGKAKLAELSDAGEDAWESMKDGIESAWETIKSAFKG